jgi:hypothetical protein
MELSQFTNRTVLSGLLGRQILPKMIKAIEPSQAPRPLFIDFKGLTATGSFFGQTMPKFKAFALGYNLYPVLCNLNNESEEELQWSTEVNAEVFITCNVDSKGSVSNPKIIGILEDKQKVTLHAVISRQVADASTLSREYASEEIKSTGWNNRLSSLATKGLIMENRNGRARTYRPVLSVME